MAKTATPAPPAKGKGTPAPPEKTTTPKKAPEKKTTLGAKEVADILGTEPATLRRFLRSKGMSAAEGRYEWEPDSKALEQLKKDWAVAQAKAATPKPEKGKKKAKAEPEESDTEEITEEEEEEIE